MEVITKKTYLNKKKKDYIPEIGSKFLQKIDYIKLEL